MYEMVIEKAKAHEQVQAQNANALCKSSDSETDRLQDI